MTSPKTDGTPDSKADLETEKEDKKEEKIKTTRTAGANRYQTAIEISKKLYDKADTVILADGNNYPDSLAAASLADQRKAPLLLTDDNQIEAVKEEISRLGANEIIIVGGKLAVGEDQEKAYAELGRVTRIAGANRYETAIKIAEEVFKANPDQDTVIVASGRGFADALAIAPYSAKEGIPIILADGDTLPEADDFLKGNKVKKAVIVGGDNSVGKVEGYFDQTLRLAGANRYETAIKIAEKFYPVSKSICIASGEKFPDSLAVSPLLAKEAIPLILTPGNERAKEVEEYIKDQAIEEIHIIGGENSVSANLFSQSKEN